jgi:hypothetical protein
VVVLEDTVNVVSEGEWQAWGLVRNEDRKDVGQVRVRARLLSGDGAVLAQPEAEVVVDPLRPGEPAPFHLRAKVPGERVARVEWRATSGPPDPRASRYVHIGYGWESDYVIEHWDEWIKLGPDIEHKWRKFFEDYYTPYELFLSIMKNYGPDLDDAMLVVAWIDNSNPPAPSAHLNGKVVWVETSRLEKPRPVPKNGWGDFEIIRIDNDLIKSYEAKFGPQYLSRIMQVYWVVGYMADER